MTKTKKKKVIQLTQTMLTHRRNGKIKYEQKAYERLRRYCEKEGLDFESCLDGATKWLRENSIAANMNGIV